MAGNGRRRRPPRGRGLVALIAAGLVFTLTGCTSDEAGGMPDPADPTATAATTGSAIPPDDERPIRETIERVNASATGAVADQRSELAAVVDPALTAAFDKCPAATSTLRFEPSYRDLRPVPGWTAQSGELSGTVYALPSLVRIFTAERITGTDLTTLHLGVREGEAYLTPLCVG